MAVPIDDELFFYYDEIEHVIPPEESALDSVTRSRHSRNDLVGRLEVAVLRHPRAGIPIRLGRALVS